VPVVSKSAGVSDEVIRRLADAVKGSGLDAEIYVVEDSAVVGREVFIVVEGLTPSKRVELLRLVYKAVPPVLVPAVHVTDSSGLDLVRRWAGDRLRKVWPLD